MDGISPFFTASYAAARLMCSARLTRSTCMVGSTAG
jgi:hypothetical protein